MLKKENNHAFLVAIAIVLLLFLAVLYKSLSLNSSSQTSPLIGSKASDIHLNMLSEVSSVSGGIVSSWPNQPKVVHFWASWCPNCAVDSAILEDIWIQYHDKGLMVVGIATQDEFEPALSTLKKLKKTYPNFFDPKGDASLEYGVTGVPETFFVDKNGVISYRITGPISFEEMTEGLKKISFL